MSRKSRDSILIGLLALILAFLPTGFSWFENVEAYTWDWRVKSLANPDKASDDVCVILLDQSSLDWAQKENGIGWPWPRELFTVILNYCSESGARSVGYDVLFTEPSFAGHEDDVGFADAIKKYGKFTIAAKGDFKKDSDFKLPDFYKPLMREITMKEGTPYNRYDSLVKPVDILAENSSIVSHVNAKPDQDGVNRGVNLLADVRGNVIPCLGLGVYLAGNPEVEIVGDKYHLHVGEKVIPVDSQGRALLNFRGPSKTHKAYSAASIIQSYLLLQEGETPVVHPNQLKDKYILFGYSAPGLHDQHNVPVSGKYPGVEVHATFIDNLLAEDFFIQAPNIFNILIALILCVASSFLILKNVSHGKQTFYIIFTIALPFAIAFACASSGYRVALVFPSLGVSTSLFLSLGYNYLTEGRQKRFIKYAFKHYLSTHVIDELIDNPDKLKLGGERREISIFFSDLQGFTTISERLEPEILIEVLNEYLSAMSDIILEERGTIDKYEGDAIIAFWNAPLNVKTHAVQCVKSALECQRVLAEMSPGLKEKAGSDLKMRIGMHTGPAVVGNMGASERFDYTMLGDSVNLAARLEGVNKQFGTYTMISEDTKNQLGGAFPVRELARVAVVGRNEPVTVYEPMFPEEFKTKKAYLEKFSEGLNLFYQEKFSEAKIIFTENSENDPPSAFYARKCQSLLESGEGAPKGVWVMTSK